MKSYTLAALLSIPIVAPIATTIAVQGESTKSAIKSVADVSNSVGNIYLTDHNRSGSIIVIGKKQWEDSYRYSALTAYHIIDDTLEDETKNALISFRENFHGSLINQELEFYVNTKIPALDLAIISFDSTIDVDVIEIATEDEFKQIKAFEPIYAIGCDLGRGPTLRVGNIGATDMVVPSFLKKFSKHLNNIPWVDNPLSFFRPHMNIWSGASGGAVLNKEGKLIGIINAMANSWNGPVSHQCIALNVTQLKFLIDEQIRDN